MKTRLLLATALACTASVSQAATVLGFDIGAYAWASDLKGSAQNTEFEGDTETNAVFFAALEHPVPFVPNVRLSRSDISQSTDNKTDIDASHTDATLYYEVLDNWISLDLGIAARKHDGDVMQSSVTQTIDSTLAMGYVKAEFDIPNTGLGIGAEFYHGKGSGDEKATDANAFIHYNIALGFNLGAGYRALDTDLDIDNDTVNLKFDGAYITAFYHF